MITLLQSVIGDDAFVDLIDADKFGDADAVTVGVHEISYAFRYTDGSIRFDLDPKDASSTDDVQKIEVRLSNAEALSLVSAAELGDPDALDPNVYEVSYVFVFEVDASGERSIRFDVEPKPAE